MEGAIHDLKLFVSGLGKRLAFEEKWPQWKPGSEFKATREGRDNKFKTLFAFNQLRGRSTHNNSIDVSWGGGKMYTNYMVLSALVRVYGILKNERQQITDELSIN
jgi:hypothetical protein